MGVSQHKEYISAALFAFILTLLSLFEYNLFHLLIGLMGALLATFIFILSWHMRHHIENTFLSIIGIGSLFVGFFHFLHILAFGGWLVFIGLDTNIRLQLLLTSEFFLVISITIALLSINKQVNSLVILVGYITAGILLFTSILIIPFFPICYIDGVGLTPFKIFSEIIFIVILLVVLVWFSKKLDKNKVSNLYKNLIGFLILITH